MLPSERQKNILDLLSTKNVVSIVEFIEKFNVSVETVRRDLSILEKESKIQKVYGGAKIKDPTLGESSMENRMTNKLLQKDSIGKKCSEFIQDGDCIFIDSGSTTCHITKHIKDKKNLTIITNSIPVVNELMNSDFEIIIIGGKIRHTERSVVTYDYIFDFSQLNITKSFICAAGITVDNGVSDFNMQEAVTRKTIIERSKEVFIAADSSKFGKNATINIATLDKIDFIITDSYLDKKVMTSFKKIKTVIILAQ